jgi:hypothetical protein
MDVTKRFGMAPYTQRKCQVARYGMPLQPCIASRSSA